MFYNVFLKTNMNGNIRLGAFVNIMLALESNRDAELKAKQTF
jgi:hypothetical protein